MNQDQCLDDMDWQHLRARLAQNALPERIANLWLERGLAARDLRTV
jgi:hypothetical protein